jgi:glycosyltransferase involved in cell wall biosynthesis
MICSGSRTTEGGVEQVIADLCANLPRYGIEPIVGLGKGARFNDPDRYRAAFPDVQTVDIDGSKGTRQARVEGLLRTFRSLKPDIVLIARVFDAYEALRKLKQREEGPRLAVTIQAYEPQYIYDARLYRDFVDLAVTSGEMIRNALIDYSGLPEDRAVSIPGGVRLPTVPVLPRPQNKRIRLGYVGRLDPGQKRILDIVPFIAGLEEKRIHYSLDIVGNGPADLELRKRLSSRESAGKVVFHGWQDHDSLYRRIFPQLDVLVHFAHTEGVTIAPREAMVHGVVPVISEFVGLKTEGHFQNQFNALTFPVGDVKAAVKNVERLVRENGLLTRLSKNAMQSQTAKYTHEGAIEAWAMAFYACLEKPVTTGDLPQLPFPPDGRLTRMGLPSWVAQRVRDVTGARYIHTDPGSEWPTGSGLCDKDTAESIMRFAWEYERNCS